MRLRNSTSYRFFLRMELCGSSLEALKSKGCHFDETTLTRVLNQVRFCVWQSLLARHCYRLNSRGV